MAKRIIVIGAGITGVSLAFHLQSLGAEVLVLDEGAAPAGVATPKSWAWINASWGNPEPYFRLRHHAMKRWKQLDQKIPGLQVNWCGGLLWDLSQPELEAYVRERQAQGYAIALLDAAAIRAREPHLVSVPKLAVLASEEGSVEPEHAVERIAAASRGIGVDFASNTHVKWLVAEADRITGVMTDDGTLSCDTVVVAAGVGAVELLAGVGRTLALDQPPGLLIHTAPAPELLQGLVMAPELHVRQTAEGRLVVGSDFGGSDPTLDPKGEAEKLFTKLQALLKGGDKLVLEHFTIGTRPSPPDGVPAIGPVPGLEGLYLAVTHSGITLAPAIGELAAREIVEGNRDPLLAPFGPGRLITHTA